MWLQRFCDAGKILNCRINSTDKRWCKNVVSVAPSHFVFLCVCLFVSGSLTENGVSSSGMPDISQKATLSSHLSSQTETGSSGTEEVSFSPRPIKQECDLHQGPSSSAAHSLCSSSSTSTFSSSSSSSPSSSSTAQRPSQSTQMQWHSAEKGGHLYPRTAVLSRAAYSLLVPGGQDQPSSSALLPHADVAWSSPLRPPLPRSLSDAEQSLYYRQWTAARKHHADAEGPATPHPRRLLLSGPPQVRPKLLPWHWVRPPLL